MAKKVKKIIKTAAGQLGGHDQSRSAPDPGRPTETKPAYNLENDGVGLNSALTPKDFLKPNQVGEEIDLETALPGTKVVKPPKGKYAVKAPR